MYDNSPDKKLQHLFIEEKRDCEKKLGRYSALLSSIVNLYDRSSNNGEFYEPDEIIDQIRDLINRQNEAWR